MINENCPACFEQPKERDRVKKLLVQEEAMIPALFFNLKRALVPLMADETYEVMGAVVAAADARGRNPMHRLPPEKKARGGAEGAGAAGAGPGPGMFGLQSHLTNGKTRRGGEGTGASGEVVAAGVAADGTDAANGTSGGGMVGDEGSGQEEEGDVVQAAKRAKYEDDEDDDQRGSSACSGGHCPPCYELA